MRKISFVKRHPGFVLRCLITHNSKHYVETLLSSVGFSLRLRKKTARTPMFGSIVKSFFRLDARKRKNAIVILPN